MKALIEAEKKLRFKPNILTKEDVFICSCNGPHPRHFCKYKSTVEMAICEKTRSPHYLSKQQQCWIPPPQGICLIQYAQASELYYMYVVEPVYSKHPCDPKQLSWLQRCPYFRDSFIHKSIAMGPQPTVLIIEVSLFSSVHNSRFHCMCLSHQLIKCVLVLKINTEIMLWFYLLHYWLVDNNCSHTDEYHYHAWLQNENFCCLNFVHVLAYTCT